MIQRTDVMTLPQSEHASDGDASDIRQFELVGVSSGVAAGRKLQVRHNARVEWWTMLTTLDQFDACLTAGPLRFQDPILFAQFRREFEHVFSLPNAHGLDPGPGREGGLCGASP